MPRRREADDTDRTDDLVVIELDDPERVAAAAAPAPTGAGGEPRRRRIRALAVVVVGVLAVGVAVTAAQRSGRRARHDATGAARDVVHRGGAPLLPFATGTALVVADGPLLRRVDVDTGDETAARFPAFAAGGLQLELATSDAVVVRTPSQDASGWTRFVVPADLRGAPVGIATDTVTIATAPDGSGVLRLDGTNHRVDEFDALGHVRAVRVDGSMTGLTVVGTRAGVLVAEPGSWVLVDPRATHAPAPPLHPGSLIAAGPATAISAAADCVRASCPVQVVDLVTGAARQLPDHGLGAFLASYGAHGLDLGLIGQVSPDARHLAAIGANGALVVVDLLTGEIDETHVDALGLGSVAWAFDGSALFALAADEDRGSVAAYVPDTRATRLLRLGLHEAVSLVAVPGRAGGPAGRLARSPSTSAPSGPLLGGHTGLRIVSMEPSSLRVVDADTGATTEVPIPDEQLETTSSAGDDSFATIPAEAGRVPIVVGDAVVFLHGGSAVAFTPRTGRFRELGPARRVFASNTPGRVWLVAPGPPTGTGAVVWSTDEVDVHTATTTAASMVPGETLAVADRGLLFEEQTPVAARFVVWDPSTGRAVGSVDATTAYASALAAHGRWFVYFDPDCGCVRVVDLTDGARNTVDVAAQTATFSPDGRAVALSTGSVAGTWTVVDLASPRWNVVPSLGLDGARPVWSPDGRWLFGASYGGGVHALPLPGGARNWSAEADVPPVSGATWFAVVGPH